VGGITTNILWWQWGLVIGSSLLLLFWSPWAKTADSFFSAKVKDKSPNWILLTGSLVISWVFAKSITNAADLGNRFGVVGGLAYAAYYLSFIVAGIVIYFMRVKGGYKSIHEFLQSRFGKAALILFSIIIAFRLFNEVWSNTMVIGSYFGETGSGNYYLSILVFTFLTLLYALKGGLNSSIFSDAIQMVLFAILLGVILFLLLGDREVSVGKLMSQGSFSWSMGLNLLFAAILQSLSYPFHDPVLTDRGFISSPKTTLRSFLLAGLVGGLCIFLFSFLGIYGGIKGFETGNLVSVAQLFGLVMLLLINFFMIVSAASTLDSSFAAFSKLVAVDLKGGATLRFGRITMILVAILGTIPVFFSPEILSATTVSGTMVIGLTPVFLFWWLPAPAVSFFLSVGMGMFFGILLAFNAIPEWMIFTKGPYADLLWANIFGILCCLLVYFIPLSWTKRVE
jgi:Na+/proline symporter